MNIEFKIVKWTKEYELLTDGKTHYTCKHGELRKVFYEMEKIARLRFKGELKHK